MSLAAPVQAGTRSAAPLLTWSPAWACAALMALVGVVTVAAWRGSAFQRTYLGTHPDLARQREGLLRPLPQAIIVAVCCGGLLAWGTAVSDGPRTVVAVVVGASLAQAASVDAVCHRLPNRLLSVAAGAAAAGSLLVAVSAGDPWTPLRALAGGLGTGTIALVLASIGSGMGMGDVKLLFVIGLWLGALGLTLPLWAMAAGVLLAGPVALVRLASGRTNRKDTMAFGPYLVAGALLTWALLT